MAIIAIDGACRRNGQPDCCSTGGVFVKPRTDGVAFTTRTVSEFGSTNQRGELLALIKGLALALELVANDTVETVYMVTDSEYMFNAVTKEWYNNWVGKGWITSAGTPVKNRDLWEQIMALMQRFDAEQIVFYHVKGHTIPFGKVRAGQLMLEDPSCELLYSEVKQSMSNYYAAGRKDIDKAWDLFLKNNGVTPTTEVFLEFLTCNIVADLIAGDYADEMDSVRIK